MNNLHRELAPISDAAWAQIEEETSRTLKRYFAGRRFVDVSGPVGFLASPIASESSSVTCIQRSVSSQSIKGRPS